MGDTLQIVDARTLQPLNAFTGLDEQDRHVPAWSPEGNRLAIINGYEIEIWEEPSNPELAERLLSYQIVTEHSPEGSPIYAMAWSPVGEHIAASTGQLIDIWSVETGESQLQFFADDLVFHLRYRQDGRLAGGGGNLVTLWDADTGEALKYFYVSTMGIASILDMGWSPDGRRMAVSFSNYEDEFGIQIWDATTDQEYTGGGSVDVMGVPDFTGHTRHAGTLSWSADGRYVASGSDDGTVRIWDVETTREINFIPVGENLYTVRAVAWSPIENRLAYANGEVGLKIISINCTITTRFGVNLRSGPGQDHAQAGSRAGDQPLEANGQIRGGDGFIWWRLSSGEWVREDLVTEDDNCASLPEPETTDTTSLLDDVCTITAIERTHLRRGPGDDFDIVGYLDVGQLVDAFGYFPNIDGTWWATPHGWIRRDFVLDASDCSRLQQTDGYFPLPSHDGPGLYACVLTLVQDVTFQAGPGTFFDGISSHSAGEQFEASGCADEGYDFVWWELTTGEWMRGDMVSTSEACDLVPEIRLAG